MVRKIETLTRDEGSACDKREPPLLTLTFEKTMVDCSSEDCCRSSNAVGAAELLHAEKANTELSTWLQ